MDELRTTLAIQRARRNTAHKRIAASQPRKTNQGLAVVSVSFILLGLALFLIVLTYRSSNAPSILPISPAVLPSATIHPAVVTLASTSSPIPLTRVVCISIGWVHVRFAPGDDQPVRGYLGEGETVVLDNDPGNSAWAHLSSPVVGWVDARFLCEGEQP
jgi:hypothetical protein